MATKYVRAAGGAWGDAATWALTSGGTEVTTVPTAADDVVTDSNSGASAVDANISVKSFVQTGTPGAITNNGFTISSAGNVTLLSGKYIAASNAARISITAAGTLITGGNAMGGVILAAAAVCGDNLTFIANKLCTLILNGNFLDVNGKTIAGNSATNRLLIYSNTIGTPRTITVAGGTFANCDFQDIAFANGGSNLDLSSGSIGNCGGNSMSGGGTLTFPPVRTCTFASTGGNWSDAAKWTDDLGGHNVPLVHHLARTQPMSAGQTITVDMPRLPDTDFSGCGASNLPAVNLTTTGLTYAVYGSWNLTGVGTYTRDKSFTFASRSNASLTSNGKNFGTGTLLVAMPGCTMTFSDALTTGGGLWPINGTVSSPYNVTCLNYSSAAGSVTTVTGSPVWTITDSSWSALGTFNAGTSTIALTYTGALAKAFAGGTNTYNNIQIAPGSGVLTFSGAFTFANMTMSSAGTRSIVFTKATTYTQTGDTFLSGQGYANNLWDIKTAYNADGVHYNVDGHTAIANIIAAANTFGITAKANTPTICAPYIAINDGAANWGFTSRDLITIGSQHRIRQSGSITQARLRIKSITNTTDLRIRIWRKSTGTTYTLVGDSGNLISQITAQQINTVTFPAITGVLEGDYVGYAVTAGVGAPQQWCILTAQTAVDTYGLAGSPYPTVHNTATDTKYAGVALPIEVYVETPPVIVSIGDSIIAGHPANYSFIEANNTQSLSSTIAYIVSNALGCTYQNMGIGGQTTTQIAARFAADVVALNPRWCIVEGGVNDLAGGTITLATFIANWATMLNAAQAADIGVIALKILPWTNGTEAQMKKRDEWNNALETLCTSYQDCILLDLDATVGLNRAGISDALITIASNTAGEPFTLSKASGLIASNFLVLKDSIATGGAIWLAGYNSTNVSGNTGWHFNSPASGAGSIAVTGVGVGKALCRAIGAGVVAFTGSSISNVKALCKAIGAGTVRFLATVFPTVAVWDVSSFFKATERYVGQYFKASKRRK